MERQYALLDSSKNEYKHSFGTVRPLDACWVNKVVRICAWRSVGGFFGLFDEDFRRFNEAEWTYELRRKKIEVTEDDPYWFAEAMSPLNPFPFQKSPVLLTALEPDEELADIPPEQLLSPFGPFPAAPGTAFMPPPIATPRFPLDSLGDHKFDPDAWNKRTVPQDSPSPYADPAMPWQEG